MIRVTQTVSMTDRMINKRERGQSTAVFGYGAFSIANGANLGSALERDTMARFNCFTAIIMALDLDYSRRNKKARQLTESEKERLEEFVDAIHYSARYSDDDYEYRHVQLPKQMLKAIPKEYFDGARGTLKLLWEEEWRGLGITQSLGWEHYEVHEPEPHILLFKRPINYQAPAAH
ncbi:hypothetical protein B0A49_10283 [Cryomyces minteri]|uniref:Cyclin-dependent kinases regulatory subunit n=2 Tax=Cryomyces TaxID=329878 RepID=A0A4U0VW89_9PEZI|nr:hypothetical protein B0A49_10283 [Cryomyces minteri]